MIGQAMVLIFNPDATLNTHGDPAMPVPAHGATGPGHLCFRVASADFPAVLERLAGHGIVEIEGKIFTWPNRGAIDLFLDLRATVGMCRATPLGLSKLSDRILHASFCRNETGCCNA